MRKVFPTFIFCIFHTACLTPAEPKKIELAPTPTVAAKQANHRKVGHQKHVRNVKNSHKNLARDYFHPTVNYLQGHDFEEIVQASNNNNSFAIFALGVAYEEGIKVQKDIEIAKLYYLKALGAGSSEAYFALGLMYESGRGFEKNLEIAASLYQIAVDSGFVQGNGKLTEFSHQHPSIFGPTFEQRTKEVSNSLRKPLQPTEKMGSSS